MVAIKESLGKFNVVPSIDFDTEGAIEIPISNSKSVPSYPKVTFDDSYSPFPKVQKTSNNWDILYQTLEKENKSLKSRGIKLTKENDNKKARLNAILETIKAFFRKLLQIGNEIIKNATTSEIKDYYDVEEFDSNDVYHIAKGTTKEDELFDYADIPSYYKTRKNSYNYKKTKDNFEMYLELKAEVLKFDI